MSRYLTIFALAVVILLPGLINYFYFSKGKQTDVSDTQQTSRQSIQQLLNASPSVSIEGLRRWLLAEGFLADLASYKKQVGEHEFAAHFGKVVVESGATLNGYACQPQWCAAQFSASSDDIQAALMAMLAKIETSIRWTPVMILMTDSACANCIVSRWVWIEKGPLELNPQR